MKTRREKPQKKIIGMHSSCSYMYFICIVLSSTFVFVVMWFLFVVSILSLRNLWLSDSDRWEKTDAAETPPEYVSLHSGTRIELATTRIYRRPPRVSKELYSTLRSRRGFRNVSPAIRAINIYAKEAKVGKVERRTGRNSRRLSKLLAQQFLTSRQFSNSNIYVSDHLPTAPSVLTSLLTEASSQPFSYYKFQQKNERSPWTTTVYFAELVLVLVLAYTYYWSRLLISLLQLLNILDWGAC
jgi:hypothetical protein